MPPEYANSGNVSERTDSYAFAIIILELLLGKAPRTVIGMVIEDEAFYKNILDNIDMSAGSWTKKAVLGLADIAERCHEHHPHKRSTVRGVIAKLKAVQASAGSSFSAFDSSQGRSTGDTAARRLELAKEAEYDELTSAPANAAARKLVVLDWNSGAASSVVSLPFAELEAATHGFAECNQLGEGGSCVVFKGQLFGAEVAVKRLGKAAGGADGAGSGGGQQAETQLFEAEMKLCTSITHANLCRMLAFATDGPRRCLVLELCTGGALNDRLACRAEGRVAPPPLPWQHRVQIALGVAEAVVHLHSQAPSPVIHRCA